MSRFERLNEPPAKKNRPTALDIWFDGLAKSEQSDVAKAAASKDWQHVELLPELVAEGAPSVSPSTLASWRKRRFGWSGA